MSISLEYSQTLSVGCVSQGRAFLQHGAEPLGAGSVPVPRGFGELAPALLLPWGQKLGPVLQHSMLWVAAAAMLDADETSSHLVRRLLVTSQHSHNRRSQCLGPPGWAMAVSTSLWPCFGGCLVRAGGRGGCLHRGLGCRSMCWASRGSPGGSVFYLGPVFECLEVLLSRCFLAHAGSVYKKRLKAQPLRAAQGIGLQMDAGGHSPALCLCQGHRVTFGRIFLKGPRSAQWLTKA